MSQAWPLRDWSGGASQAWPHDPADEPLLKLRDELDRLRTENVRLQAMLRYLGYDPLAAK